MSGVRLSRKAQILGGRLELKDSQACSERGEMVVAVKCDQLRAPKRGTRGARSSRTRGASIDGDGEEVQKVRHKCRGRPRVNHHRPPVILYGPDFCTGRSRLEHQSVVHGTGYFDMTMLTGCNIF